jgi:three-Cys-motif partner protein
LEDGSKELSTANNFGGFWTKDKLDVLRDYLGFYTLALSKQRYQLVYVDAFAGTGRCGIKDRDGEHRLIEGSAKIALDCAGFDQYRFIEKKRKHREELEQLIAAHPNGGKASISAAGAEDALPFMLAGYDWRRWRGVLFLDPFGLQCTYDLLKRIAETKALDVFFLVSLSGLYRQAAINAADVDQGKRARLTAFLGTRDWQELYTAGPQDDLFSGPLVTREPGWEQILAIMTKRLKSLFPYVGEPTLMRAAGGAPLFALYFAVANPSGPAIGLASKVSREILSQLPG